MYQLYRERPWLVICMIIANIALSAWCIYLDPVINFDGVIYLAVAELFLQGKYALAFDYYSWPFYSMFIAATAKLLMLDTETAAYVFNTLMATSLTLAFVCLVAELSNNNKRIILIAVAIVLLFPSISKYRSFVIRDFGYLSCYLWSLYFILRYCVSWKKSHFAGWLIFAGLSSLFRFEGIVFILIAPYFLFLFGGTGIQHRKKLLVGLSLAIVSLASVLLFWYLNDKYTDSVEFAKQSGKDISGLFDLFAANIQHRLGDQELSVVNTVGLVFSSVWDVVYELLRRMAVFYLLLAVYGYFKGDVLKGELLRKIWATFLFANLAILIGFSLTNNFIVSRYTMASALTLLLLVPATLYQTLSYLKSASLAKRAGATLVAALLLVVSIEGLDVRTKKRHIQDVGVWVKENIPEDAKIYSNDKLVIYYADRDVATNLDHLYSLDIMTRFIKTNEIITLDYVIIVGQKKNHWEDVMRQTLSYKFGHPLKEFYSEKGRFAFVFKVDKKAPKTP